MSHYIVELDKAEGEQIARQAAARGYPSTVEYLRALVAADALVAALHTDWQDADESADQIEASFRESWHEALTGKVRPIEELWDSLDDDE